MPDEFTKAPEEVIRYFDAKKSVPTFDWRELAPPEHALSFTVAKSAGYDILEDIREATQKAIEEFQPYEVFRDNLEPTLRKKGWWGKSLNIDPATGRPTTVQLGSNRRLRTIYWANTRTAHAAGEWERTQRTKRGLPYLIYELSVAEKRRPEHEGWVGIILPVDDAWWLTHYPPNGWLCKCRVRQISRREAEGLGYDPSKPAPQITYRPWKNKRTGETINVPAGIDPGWQSNPGATRAQNVSKFLTDKLDAMPAASREVAVRDLIGSKVFRAMQSGELPYAGPADRTFANMERGRIALPVARLSEKLRKELKSKTGTVTLSNADAHKQLIKRITKTGTSQLDEKDYAILQKMIENGRVYQELSLDRDIILQMIVDGKGWHAVLRVTLGRTEVFLKSLRRIRTSRMGETDRIIELE